VGAPDVAALDVAQPPLGLGAAVELLAGAAAIRAGLGTEIIDNFAFSVTGKAIRSARGFQAVIAFCGGGPRKVTAQNASVERV
jgi:hypothetical protein